MIKFQTFELVFEGEEPAGSQAVVDVNATFTCGTQVKTVKGFYDGKGIYKVRFLPETEGHYTWKVSGAVSGEGEADCSVSGEYHGLVKAEGTHFAYSDGTRYLPFGTTIYALSHQTEELIDQTFKTLEAAPFNKVRHCVFPKHYDYNHNEPGDYAFERDADGKWDVNRPCFAFWAHLEHIIDRLSTLGIQSDLILFHPYDRWGFSKLSMEENRIYLDYLLRRLSANPSIWWSMANEYDMVFTKTMEDWYAIEEQLAAGDVYHHLLSNHNCFGLYDFTRKDITHCSIQTAQMHHGAAWQKKYGKPVIFDECCYEGNLELDWGNISAFEMVNRFWCACTVGAYATHGEVFLSEDEILWWARGGVLKGESPARIAYLKDIISSFPAPLEHWDAPKYMGEAAGKDTNGEKQPKDPMENPFIKLIMSLPEIEREVFLAKSTSYTGHCKDAVYLHYFAHQCSSACHMELPDNASYQVEVLDVWNMTRHTVMEDVSGNIIVKLPGKEGMAILATKM